MAGDNRRPDKRQAIVTGALAVFARDGYARAGIDAIAAEAGVSTRTIYNHFQDKAQLFATVIRESATQVADAQIALIDRHLFKVTDLEADLVALGCALATPLTGHAGHFGLIRQINAETEHIPDAAIAAWRAAGPERVLGELADRLGDLAARGLLHLTDPHRAASQFMLLASGAIPFHHGIDATAQDEIAEIVASGVHVFLHGYLPPIAKER